MRANIPTIKNEWKRNVMQLNFYHVQWSQIMVQTHLNAYTHIHVHVFIYIYIHVCMCAYMPVEIAKKQYLKNSTNKTGMIGGCEGEKASKTSRKQLMNFICLCKKRTCEITLETAISKNANLKKDINEAVYVTYFCIYATLCFAYSPLQRNEICINTKENKKRISFLHWQFHKTW